jgi:hypothetical protein
MSIILFIIIVLVVLALVCYAISLLPMVQQPFKALIMFLAVVLGILAICHRVGWL